MTPPITPGDIVGAGMVPLPAWRLLSLVDWLEEQLGMGNDLAGRVRARIAELRPLVSDAEFEDGVAVHGDASFANVLWHQGRLVALLDLEWARLGPPDLEFATIGGGDADIQVRGFTSAVSASELPLLTWLRDGYPELFERRHLTERVWLYDAGVLTYGSRIVATSTPVSFSVPDRDPAGIPSPCAGQAGV